MRQNAYHYITQNKESKMITTARAGLFPTDKEIYAADGKTVIGAIHGDNANGQPWSAWSRTANAALGRDDGFDSWQVIGYHGTESEARTAVLENHYSAVVDKGGK